MCVFFVKNDKDRKPLRAKSRTVVLRNFEDRLYQKSQCYHPVIKYSSVRLLTTKAVGNKRILQKVGLQERVLQCKASRWWSHCDPTSHCRPRFSRQWSLDPQENATWLTSIPPSLVQYDKMYSSQDETQSLTTLPLPYLWYTYQTLLSRLHSRPTIPTSCRTLCWQLCILLLCSSPGGTIQNPATRKNPSGTHGKCRLLLRYCI